jgi:hypothetical protein
LNAERCEVENDEVCYRVMGVWHFWLLGC